MPRKNQAPSDDPALDVRDPADETDFDEVDDDTEQDVDDHQDDHQDGEDDGTEQDGVGDPSCEVDLSEGGVEDTSPARTPKRQRSGQSRTTPSTRTTPLRLDRATKIAIDRIDDHERRYAFTAAGGGALLWTAVYLSSVASHHVVPKGQLSTGTEFVFGLVVCAFVLMFTLIRRRALVGFGSLFLALTLTSSPAGLFLALPFFVFGGWLIIRAFKIQARVARGEVSAEEVSGGKVSSALSTQQSSRRSSTSTASRSSDASLNKRYTNKRYTPPKAKARKPKPTA